MGVSIPSAGKGSGRRPSDVPKEQVDKNWETIFGKKTVKKPSTDNAVDHSAPVNNTNNGNVI